MGLSFCKRILSLLKKIDTVRQIFELRGSSLFEDQFWNRFIDSSTLGMGERCDRQTRHRG